VAALDVNTNNHLERFNGLLKYVFMNRKKARQIAELLLKLVTDVMVHYMQDRQKKLSGLESSGICRCNAMFLPWLLRVQLRCSLA
jgi:hypothetical protein